MSKRKTGWKEWNWARDKRKFPLEDCPQSDAERIEAIGEDAYEMGVIHQFTASDLEPEDRRRDCPWKCADDDPGCLCMGRAADHSPEGL